MNTHEKVRLHVAETYARAVERGSGCCDTTPKGVAAKVAGYGEAETAAVPADAVVNSFGCGNPVAFGEVREGDVVLDLGSGAGLDLLLAARKVGPTGRVLGVDMTDAMIERARANAAAAGLSNVEIRKGIIESLPVESGSVDWVISNCVINLSPEKEKVFAEIARVLKPGGRMIVSDIVVEELPAWARENAAIYCSCVGGAISEADYAAGLVKAGLGDVEVRSRFVYEPEHVAGLIESDRESAGPSAGPAPSGCCGVEAKIPASRLESLRGKIWSATFAARKPAGGGPAA